MKLGVGRGVERIWEELGMGKECDQNISYEKNLNKKKKINILKSKKDTLYICMKISKNK